MTKIKPAKEERLSETERVEYILESISAAPTMGALSFYGDVVRLHKLYEFPYTQIEQNMLLIRAAWLRRKSELLEEESRSSGTVRQQRDSVTQRAATEGDSPGVHGERNGERGGVLPGRMGQREEGRDGEILFHKDETQGRFFSEPEPGTRYQHPD